MPSSGNAAPRKCFSGILSRLLCSGSLPTHPSDEFIEPSIKKLDNQKPDEKSLIPEDNIAQVAAAASTPGVVARLMGLESFPTPRDRNLGDFFRSKSANSIDFLAHFDPIKHGHHQHRRVRTSVSFREGINDDVTSIILRLKEMNETRENEEEEEELFIRKRPNVKCQYRQGRKENETRRKNREFFQERKVSDRPGKNLEMNEQVKSVSIRLSPGPGPGNSASQKRYFQGNTRINLKERRPIIKTLSCTEELIGSKRVKKKKNKILAHKVHYQKKIHPEFTVPEVAREISSRKQLSSRTANSRSPYASGVHCDDVEVRAIITGKNVRKMKIMESCYYKRMLEKIYVLTEEDVKENWINHGMVLKFEDFVEVCQQFGQEILEVMLEQLVDELVCYFLGPGISID